MKAKMLALALGAVPFSSGIALVHGERIYYRGSESAIGQTVAVPVVAPAPVVAGQYAAPPVAPVLPAAVGVPVAPAGCVNCTPGSAQAKNCCAGTLSAIGTSLQPYTTKAVSTLLTLPY